MIRRQLTVGVALSAAVVTLLYLLPEASPFSPGPLAADHANLACDACHDGFDSFDGPESNRRCAACHEDEVRTPAKRFAGSRCVGCHREHRGRDHELAETSAGACTAACHSADTVHGMAPVMMSEQLSAAPRDCLRCHGNHDEHRMFPEPSLAMVRKHLIAAHRKSSPLYHKDTCAKCHVDKLQASGAQAASVPGFFDPHVAHVVRLQIRCSWCHDDVDIRQHSGTRLRRTVDTARCAQCHEGEYYPMGSRVAHGRKTAENSNTPTSEAAASSESSGSTGIKRKARP